MNRIIFFLVFAISTLSNSQSPLIDAYIYTAFSSNLALQQKEYSYHKNLEALKQAKKMYLPTVSFQARYTITEGGRTMTIPTGDLLNPAYNNLNKLNQAQNSNTPFIL
jgi:outer membrane protein